MNHVIRQRLKELRREMEEFGLDAYLVPSTDPHMSEYVPECWRRRAFMSGFDGSAGDLVVTRDQAALWTDSRYFLQAETQLEGTGIRLMKMGVPNTLDMERWLGQVLPAGAIVGVDPQVVTTTQFGSMAGHLEKHGLKWEAVTDNLVDRIWTDRPVIPADPAQVYPESFSGESYITKLERLRKRMADMGAEAHVLTTLDAIAWLFNIRGTDVAYNPVVIAYAVITKESAVLLLPEAKVTPVLREHLADVMLERYDDTKRVLNDLAKSGVTVLLDRKSVSQWVVDTLDGAEVIFGDSPVSLMKAVKNEIELEGIRSAHVRDGVAMVQFLKWLEDAVPSGSVTEMSASDRLFSFRSRMEHFQGESFSPISAYGAHGAIVHYSATPETDIPLKPEGIYLIDSGGQYLDGTTDITRTISLGKPTPEHRKLFTLVLKGHIALSMTRFPEGTVGKQLDTIARKPLWDEGMNYLHGTGHGVGAYLNVHEGPHAISYYRCVGVPLMPGMITSIEPGYYREGAFGIRIENLVEVVEVAECSKTERFLGFRELTLCPIDRDLVEPELLDDGELKWLNAYHRTVYDMLAPHLDETHRKWLADATAEIN